MNINFWSFLLFSCAFQGVVLAAGVMVVPRGNPVSNRLLSALVIVVSVILAEYVAYSSHLAGTFPFIEFGSTPLMFLIGPLFLFYVRSLLEPRFSFRWRDMLHFILFLALTMNYVPYYQLLGDRLWGWGPPYATVIVEINGYLAMAAHIVVTAVYVVIGYATIRAAEIRAKNEDAETTLVQFDWLRRFFIVFIAFLLVEIPALIVMAGLKTHLAEIEYIMAMSLAAIIFFAGYHAIAQPEIFTSLRRKDPAVPYRKSRLSPETVTSYAGLLMRHMETNKPFLDPEFNLGDLSGQLSIPRNHLSQTLNVELGVSFFDLVNRFRVEEAKRRLVDPSYGNLTIITVAFDSGFSSKASFNRIFKEATGVTPSAFAAEHRAKTNPVAEIGRASCRERVLLGV